MKKILLIVPLISVVLSCSTVGLIKKTEDPNVFNIVVHSNAFSNAEKVMGVFKKKAEKACGGRNYEFVSDIKGTNKNIKTYGANATSTNVLMTEMLVRCKDEAAL